MRFHEALDEMLKGKICKYKSCKYRARSRENLREPDKKIIVVERAWLHNKDQVWQKLETVGMHAIWSNEWKIYNATKSS